MYYYSNTKLKAFNKHIINIHLYNYNYISIKKLKYLINNNNNIYENYR